MVCWLCGEVSSLLLCLWQNQKNCLPTGSHPLPSERVLCLHKGSAAWSKCNCHPTQWPCICNTPSGYLGAKRNLTVIFNVHQGLHWFKRKSKFLNLAFKTLHNLSMPAHFLRSPKLFRDMVSICRVCLPWIQFQHPQQSITKVSKLQGKSTA